MPLEAAAVCPSLLTAAVRPSLLAGGPSSALVANDGKAGTGEGGSAGAAVIVIRADAAVLLTRGAGAEAAALT
jgi:hypothetical protein